MILHDTINGSFFGLNSNKKNPLILQTKMEKNHKTIKEKLCKTQSICCTISTISLPCIKMIPKDADYFVNNFLIDFNCI